MFLLITIFLFSVVFSPVVQAKSFEGWHLVWQDEFNGNTVDLSKWRIEDAALRKNNELQYYTPEDVYVHDGVLTLRSQKREMKGRDFTSGLVDTKGKFSQKYGYFEVRAKFPKGKGIWPAQWMLPDSGKWPPEIDIAELLGHSPSTIHTTHHWGVWPDRKKTGGMYTTTDDYSTDFHTFAVEWSPESLTWYVDQKECFVSSENIPQEPFYIILNTAVGGDWPGNPNSATKFPQYHDIDYIRVYAKEIQGAYFLTTLARNGSIIVSPEKDNYTGGEEITLLAKPGIGYKFAGWSVADLTAENPAKFIINSHQKIQAKFVKSKNSPRLLSQNKQAKASSLEAGEYSPQNVTDGNLDTRWSSEFSEPQWIQVDLGRIYKVEAIRLSWEVAYATAYKIQVSADEINWITVYSTNEGAGYVEEITQFNFQARYVRIYGNDRATEFGVSLWELEVFGG
ncbi:MAG: family 16 glycosylhydrolase [Candidatus Heimdallarchaeota archaeon]|nr:family 16 glycosylhydrolase [Candidatus Heimdallarchaeota archaeon]